MTLTPQMQHNVALIERMLEAAQVKLEEAAEIETPQERARAFQTLGHASYSLRVLLRKAKKWPLLMRELAELQKFEWLLQENAVAQTRKTHVVRVDQAHQLKSPREVEEAILRGYQPRVADEP